MKSGSALAKDRAEQKIRLEWTLRESGECGQKQSQY